MNNNILIILLIFCRKNIEYIKYVDQPFKLVEANIAKTLYYQKYSY